VKISTRLTGLLERELPRRPGEAMPRTAHDILPGETFDEGPPECPACSGPGAYLGNLGTREHFRCQNCGMDFSHVGPGPDNASFEAKKDPVNALIETSITPLGPNQTVVIKDNGDQIFFSYKTPVAAHIGGKRYRTEKQWSVTTSKHINNYLSSAQAETKPQEFFDKLL